MTLRILRGCAVVLALTGGALGSASQACADDLGYLVNVTLKPGYNFPNAGEALRYGHMLCDRIAAGDSYSTMASRIQADFAGGDEYLASYLLSQAAQQLCPAQIWQLRQSVVVPG